MSTQPRVLGVIPARGGSKRLPTKNIMPIAGKPLIAWTIEAAAKAKSLTDWLVSSEDEDILRVAREYGAPTPFVRPAELSQDNVRNIEPLRHALFFMEEMRGQPYDMLVLLHPTSPIRDPGHIDDAVARLWASDLDSAASVKGPFKKKFPTIKAIRDGVLENYCQEFVDGQEIEPFYLYNAALYVVKRDYFVEQGTHLSERQIPILMDEFHSSDVNTLGDFLKTEALLKHLLNHPKDKE